MIARKAIMLQRQAQTWRAELALMKCRWWMGNDVLRDPDPQLHEYEDVILVPETVSVAQSLPGGVFLADGTVCLPAQIAAIPAIVALQALAVLPPAARQQAVAAPQDCYIYLGYPPPHYGHFLMSFISRLWAHAQMVPTGYKIILYGQEAVESLYKLPIGRAVLEMFGIGRERFVSFHEVTHIRRLIIPAVALGENDYVHRCFAELGHEIGRHVLTGASLRPNDRPVYLSKASLKSGVNRLVNEDEVINVLAAHGIDIVSPETLTFAEQVALYYERDVVMGTMGSALHTSIFAPGRTIIGLGYTDWYLSNYRLVDKVNGNDAHYYYPEGDLVAEPDGGAWQGGSRLSDPVKTAHELLRVTDRIVTRKKGGRDACGWRNLALAKLSHQSSILPAEFGMITPGQVATATSGVLTGRYQFHTRHEAEPWWTVDLGCVCEITKVVLHNRIDSAPVRRWDMYLSVSDDNLAWTELFALADATVGNGITGDALVVDMKARGRFVRVGLRGEDILHLDQVEVFGPG